MATSVTTGAPRRMAATPAASAASSATMSVA